MRPWLNGDDLEIRDMIRRRFTHVFAITFARLGRGVGGDCIITQILDYEQYAS